MSDQRFDKGNGVWGHHNVDIFVPPGFLIQEFKDKLWFSLPEQGFKDRSTQIVSPVKYVEQQQVVIPKPAFLLKVRQIFFLLQVLYQRLRLPGCIHKGIPCTGLAPSSCRPDVENTVRIVL